MRVLARLSVCIAGFFGITATAETIRYDVRPLLGATQPCQCRELAKTLPLSEA